MFKRWRLILVSILVVMVLVPVTAFTLGSTRAASPGQSFTFLQAGFTQQIFGVSSSFLGGVAFAPNGDPWVDECAFAGSNLHRFDAQTTTVVNSTTLHPESIVASAAGCGMTNHPDGTLYSNTSNGVANLDANTGALIRTLGPPGNVLGITVDPQTNHLVYVGADCRFTATCSIIDLDPVSGTYANLAVLSATDAQFVDGIYFDSTGNFLFMSNRSPQFRLTVLNRSGAIVQHVPMTSEPDGIAFHGGTTQFVVTNNTDGTMTRFDFPNNDFTQTPTQAVFASGGFRGDLSQVGSDNCLYITQDGTRYDDGTVTSQDSLVRLCPGFVPPPGVGLSPPQNATATAGDHSVTVSWQPPAPNGNVITQYRVISLVSDEFAPGTVVTVVPGTVTSVQIPQRLHNCEKTQWAVQAVDAQQNVSAPATTNEAWPHGSPQNHNPPSAVIILLAGINSQVSDGTYSPIGDVSTYCSNTGTPTQYPSKAQPLTDIMSYFHTSPSDEGAPGYSTLLTDALAGNDAVILPFSYAGATFVTENFSAVNPQFKVTGYHPTTVANQSIATDADYLNKEVVSVHKTWPQAHIFIIGHSNGGLVAEQWWLKQRNPYASNQTISGVVHVWSLDSPLHGVKNGNICATGICGSIGVGPALALDYITLWNNQASGEGDPKYLKADTQDHGIFTPVGTNRDPVYDLADTTIPGIISQLYFNEPVCSLSGFLPIICQPQSPSMVSPCAIPLTPSLVPDHFRVVNCPGVISSIVGVVTG